MMPARPAPTALPFLIAAALSACGDPAEPPVPTTLEVTPSQVSFAAVGDTARLQGRVRDQYGDVMTDVNIRWSSLKTAVAKVGIGSGLVTSGRNGTTSISARARSLTGRAQATVLQEVRALEKARGDGQVGYPHEPLPVSPAVLAMDANGNPAQDITVAFEVTSGGGTVSDASVVTALGGIAETSWTLGPDPVHALTVSTAGLTAVFRATRGPVRIATDSLDLGRVALRYIDTLEAKGGTGRGYSWSLAEGGALPRGLDIESHGVIRGTPDEAGTFEFTVRVVDSEGDEATAALEMRVCKGPLGLAVGDVRVFEPGDVGPCGVFVRAPEASAYYRVTLAGLIATGERLLGTTLQVEGIPASETGPHPVVAGGEPAPGGLPPRGQEVDWARALEIEAANDDLHLRIRREEAELYRRLAGEGRLGPMLERAAQASAARQNTRASRNASHTFRLRGNGCNVAAEVVADIIAENDHLVVYEEQDAESPVPRANADSIIDFYSDHGAEVIEDYFDGVSDVNGDDKIVVLIDPTLEGVRAFVWSGDMTFTADDCAASNEMELIHMSAGAFRFLNGSLWAFSGMVHEAKHVSSLYKRVRGHSKRGGSRFHPSWVEEGAAEIAKEMSSRIAWERGGGPEVGDRVTGDMMRVGLREQRVAAYGTYRLLARTVLAFSVNPNAISFEPLGRGHIYGSGWHFHRFLRDRVMVGAKDPRGADEAFVTELNDSLTRSGVDGMVEVTGETMADLLAEHATALTVAGAESELTDGDTPRFLFYEFPTATEIFTNPDPPGRYPWPVTLTGDDDLDAVPAAGLAKTGTYAGQLGGSGVRVHDFEAMSAGDGAVVRVVVGSDVRIIVARIPKS